MELGLIRPCAQLDYLPPRASLLTCTCDQPSKKQKHTNQLYTTQRKKPTMVSIPEDNQLITRKEQIIARFQMYLKG